MGVQKGIYKHFKGHVYEVIGTAKHSETLEPMVVYVNVEDPDSLWVRPEAMFLETVTRNGETFPRFELVEGR